MSRRLRRRLHVGRALPRAAVGDEDSAGVSRGGWPVSAVAATPAGARGRVPGAVFVAITAAWGLAVAADLAGQGYALHHDSLIEGGPPLWAALLLFLVAWQTMVAAMMLPSSLPLIRLFDTVSARQERTRRVHAAFLGGYAAVWTAFGALGFVGDVGLHRAVDAVPWLSER